MGAEFMDEWTNVRIAGEALDRLAGVETQPADDSLRAPSFRLLSGERVGDLESHPSSIDAEPAQ
jgi:hypothetical protein